MSETFNNLSNHSTYDESLASERLTDKVCMLYTQQHYTRSLHANYKNTHTNTLLEYFLYTETNHEYINLEEDWFADRRETRKLWLLTL